jgi:ATP-dependent RNA helicase SUPV3L1/SUV3
MRPLLNSSCSSFRLYVGPTNSGKTRAALEELGNSSGCYAGPLRLLALEGWKQLSEMGLKTSLITGQTKIIVEDATHTSCTVEMLESVRGRKDLIVLDEIQLISDESRGWGWTKAIMQSKNTKEMILCGQPNAVPLIKRLLDRSPHIKVSERMFSRISKLTVEDDVSSSTVVKNKDCLVAFSRRELYKLKRELELAGKTICLVYGAMPPEVRRLQAERFNLGHSVLVATDAVGLGLNLNIQRMIFSTVSKFDGDEHRLLTPCEVKQIAGRAGRGHELGFVTA